MTRRYLAAILILLTGFVLSGCGDSNPRSGQNEILPGTHWFDITVGGKEARVQLAVTRPEMMRGLMGRRELGEDDGMLFVHRRPQQVSFWMSNTPLPLDIGYFSPEGILLEVYPMYPYDETSVPSRSDQIQFALEMNQGWFSRNGVRPGSRMDLEQLRKTLLARGFNPSEFGL